MLPGNGRIYMGILATLFLIALLLGTAQYHARSQAVAARDMLDQQNTDLATKLKAALDDLARKSDACQIKDRALDELRAQLAVAEARLSSADRQENGLRTRMSEVEKAAADRQSLASKLDALETQYAALVKKQQEETQAAETLKARSEKASGDAQRIKEESKEKTAELTAQLAKLKDERTADEKTLAESKSQQNALQKKIADQENEISRLKDLGTKVWGELTATKKEKDALSQEIAKLKKDIDGLHDDLAKARRNNTNKRN